MESITYIKNLKVSAKKLRFLLPGIKSMKPNQALAILRYTPKKGARIFHKAIFSALTNAKNTLKTSDDLLKFKALTVEEGQKQKRWRPGGRGTAHPFRRKTSHIKIVISAEQPVIKQKVEKKKSLDVIKKVESKKQLKVKSPKSKITVKSSKKS